jgi:hypothetical protein
MKIEDKSRRVRVSVKGVGEPDFEGCVPLIKDAGGKKLLRGMCGRCGNYSPQLSDMGLCAGCEDVIDGRRDLIGGRGHF